LHSIFNKCTVPAPPPPPIGLVPGTGARRLNARPDDFNQKYQE
jgi:hypothetical protein